MNLIPDTIEVRGLRVTTHIGVPDAERANPQTLLIDLILTPRTSFANLGDRIEATVDYAAVATRIETLASARPRQLIETLAHEIAQTLLVEFTVVSVDVTIRKHILPHTEHVAVRCHRSLEDPVPRFSE